jgi:rare lipoprotein A
MDVSQRVAEALDFHRVGTARVKVDYVGRAGLEGSDDEKLLATLRDDGVPAHLPGATPIMVASRHFEPVRTAMLENPSPRAERAAPRREEPEEAATTPAAPVISARAIAIAKSAPLPPSRPFDLGSAAHGRAKQAMN